MSYRTYVNNVQLLGNNEYYDLWFDFIKSQGISIGEEYEYDGDITDFTGAIRTCEQIVMQIEQEHQAARNEIISKSSKNALTDKDFMAWLDKQYPSLFDLSGIKKSLADQAANPEKYKYCMFSLFDELYGMTTNGYLFLPITLYNICKNDVQILYHGASDKCRDRQRSFEILPGHKIHVHAG